MEPREVLEALVAPVATLGELAATVTAPRRRVWPLLYPESLHKKLRDFTWTLRDTLDHPSVNVLDQHGVTSLDQAVATLEATSGVTWADVRATVRAWQGSLRLLEENWYLLECKATELCNTWKISATEEATTTSQAGELQDETPPSQGTAGDNRVTAAPQPSVALPLVVATKAREEAVMATRRGQRQKEALELLKHLEVACSKAKVLPLELLRGLGHIEAALEGTQEVSRDVPKALAAMVAKAKLLCEASARLARRHLLVTLGEIDFLLLSPSGSSGGPGGPRGRAVAERCQRAIEDIPRLLEDSHDTVVTSSGQWCHWGDLRTLECPQLLVPPRAPRVSPGATPPPCEGPRCPQGLSLCHTPPSDTHQGHPRASGPNCTRTSPSLKQRDPHPSPSSSSLCTGTLPVHEDWDWTPPRVPTPPEHEARTPFCAPHPSQGVRPLPFHPPGTAPGLGGPERDLGGTGGSPALAGVSWAMAPSTPLLSSGTPPNLLGPPTHRDPHIHCPLPSPTPPKALGPLRSMSPPQCARTPPSPPLPLPWDVPITDTTPSELPEAPPLIEPPGTPPAPRPCAPPSPRPALGPAGAGLAPSPEAAAAGSLPSSGHAHRGAGPHMAANGERQSGEEVGIGNGSVEKKAGPQERWPMGKGRGVA
ncbi:uncharacterized protein [Sylvia atricapilla]|uniref:uncharacterized protein n=1 Tax=Sylvia atricapilla TaxID=48155 RepID=UPI0033959060